MRLASKFLLVLALGTVVLLIAFALSSHQHEQSVLESEMQKDAALLGTGLGSLFADVWTARGHERALELIDEINSQNEGVRVRWIWLDDARDSESDGRFVPQVGRERLSNLHDQPMLSFVELDTWGKRTQYTYVLVDIEGRSDGALEISEPLAHPYEALRRLLNQFFVFGTSSVLIGGALIVILGEIWVARPLKRLIEKTRRVGRGDLSGPLQMSRNDEFGELARSIDDMCEQLEAARKEIEAEHEARIATLEQLRHADRLRTVGRLASGIAHELGTPLNVVSGRASLIASGKLCPDEVEQSARAIKAETERITTIIGQLLDFARRNTPQKSNVSLRDLVRHTVEMLEPLAEKRSCEIDLQPGDNPLVAADANQVQQVLTNLIVNGIQAMPDGGRVTISVECQSIPQSDAESGPCGYARIEVADEGTGIADEDKEHLFEPFFTTKQVGEGTGLGLSIAYGIVQEHGGWINVESELSRGSRFHVFLPLEEETCAVVC